MCTEYQSLGAVAIAQMLRPALALSETEAPKRALAGPALDLKISNMPAFFEQAAALLVVRPDHQVC